ncbi:MAG: penicillin acylase family protein [Acidobacteriota bacterium]
MRRILKWTGILGGLVIILAAGMSGWAWHELRASLPQLDGERRLDGLAAPVRIATDALGVPTIRGGSRADVARAIGFLHAQNRFFQMDLLRRRAAGEIAALMGPGLLSLDRGVRVHRFRELARRIIRDGGAAQRDLLNAYSDGVNAGLAALKAVPFEYLVLRVEPAAWKPEDSVLVILTMFLDLNDDDGSRESALGLMRDLLPAPLFEFLAQAGTSWDAPLIGGPVAPVAVPGPEVIDLRKHPVDSRRFGTRDLRGIEDAPQTRTGSNNWAVGGALAGGGAAMLANDMHLRLAVPNIWYRASFEYPRPGAPPGSGPPVRVTGVTLPGVPIMIAGSNGQVAWGFTNSYGDWVDLVTVEIDPNDPERYRTPAGPDRFEHHREVIEVRGRPGETLDVLSTIWGPIIDHDHLGRPRALRWIAHEEHTVNSEMIGLETARTIEEALAVANRTGAPPQNIVVAGRDGRVGWSIMGAIPRRRGFPTVMAARLPVSWADGTHGWDGWLPVERYPRIILPPSGRIWTANARVVEGAMLKMLGDGGYDVGARAGQIRDRLLELDKASEERMLEIQLDDRAVFLQRWHDLALDVLTPEAVRDHPLRREFRKYVENWGGRAAVDSVGYRLVRAFRLFAGVEAFDPLTSECKKADKRFNLFEISQWEAPIWTLVTEKPRHLLDPRFETWDDLFLDAIDSTLKALAADRVPLARRTWGQRNTTRIAHPFSFAAPSLGRWLNMPVQQLPGDNDMPRFQSPAAGASERMVVSPGHEERGIFHMPGGQSGHPLSPHYADGHAAWAAGKPTPFLPGPAVHELVLRPAD